jgi:putative ABC transport system permease protein
MLSKHLPMILKNCWRNRRRTVLTVLSIGVSLCLMGVLLAIYQAFFYANPTPGEALRVVTRNSISLAQPMPQAYRDKIMKIPGVKQIAIEDWFGGTYIDDRPEHMFARFATDPDKIFNVRTEIKIPEDQKLAFQRDRTGCVIGRGVAESQKLKVGDKLTIMGDIYPFNLELTVRGIFDADNNVDLMYFSREYLEESIAEGRRGNAGMFMILTDSTDDVPRVEKAVDAMFRNSPTQTKTESESAFSLSFVAFLGNIKLFLLIVCAAVMFTMLLVSANTIAMSVRERVREVGVLKVLGFTNAMVLGIILTEALVVSLLGGALGVLLASFMTGVVRKGPAFLDQLKTLSLSPAVAVICLGIAAVVGLMSAFVPAFQASRISILEALRSTD